MTKQKVAIFWFRRDLRLKDNVGLHYALASGYKVVPLFIFDKNILNKLEDKKDRRLDYIVKVLNVLNVELSGDHACLRTYFDTPEHAFRDLLAEFDVKEVFCNTDYEPYALERDRAIAELLAHNSIAFISYKDQVIFHKSEIVKKDGTPYTVYTPYAKKWREVLTQEHCQALELDKNSFLKMDFEPIPSIQVLGFEETDIAFHPPHIHKPTIQSYHLYRDFPALDKTSHLGLALRFGAVSVRTCVAFALEHNATWLSELIWREFFMQILFHFPHVTTQSFKKKYDYIEWRNNEEEFEKWCTGNTGYPMVDAGMRSLNATGLMHNRVRMITASFLCKHLLIDWRWGEAYFASKLLDYDLAANNGNWQWAAGSGCDAAPYFRVFNPSTQIEKFDKQLEYIKKWVPDVENFDYPLPMVDHAFARNRALETYGKALKDL